MIKVKIKKSNLLKEIEKNKKITVKVGILHQDFGFSRYDEDPKTPTMAEIALFNDFGMGVPKRPALQRATKLFSSRFKELMEKELINAFRVGTFRHFGHIVGGNLASEMKRQIKDWTTPPNAQETIDRKGFNNPLVHTGDYYKRIAYKINNSNSYKLGDES